MVLKSAKSRLIRLGAEIVSTIPLIMFAKTRSATLKASFMGNCGTSCISLLLSITTTVSQCFRISTKAALAYSFRPFSMRKGVVTTPTVIAPFLLAISATTGAAPVPVPPPKPVVMKTMSILESKSSIRLRDSSIAALPSLGSPPTPIPLASFSPTKIFW